MRKRLLIGSLLGFISFFLIVGLRQVDFFKNLEKRLIDYRFRIRPAHKVNSQIKIVAIDDYTLQEMGRWPIPRQYQAALLKSFSDFPPRVIGFDILFTEPSSSDNAFIHHAKLLGNVVFAGYLRSADNKPVYPIPGLREVSKVGFINVPPDSDGVVRKAPLVIKNGDQLYPALSLQVLCDYYDISFQDLEISLGDRILMSLPNGDDLVIPIDDEGCLLINYVGDLAVFDSFSFLQLLSWGKTQPQRMELFSNDLILVGLTGTGTTDQGTLPLATNVPLIAVQANIINTILNKDFILPVSFQINILVVIFMIIIITACNIFYRPIRAALLTFLMILFYFWFNYWFFNMNVLLELFSPLLAAFIPFILITVYRYGWEEKQRRWIKKAFNCYLSPQVIDEVLTSPQKLKLGGELREATIFFLDIRNFTTFSEGRSPNEVVSVLNQCFDWMTEIIVRNGGMLDKYIGDAIMAIIGAPETISIREQAERAVTIALEIAEKRKELSPDLGIGIGINTGSMVVGNMGSSNIFDYTAIGDEVNVARRVQELTRQYGVEIIIAQSVYELVKDMVIADPLGDVSVKGRKEPVHIYALKGRRP